MLKFRNAVVTLAVTLTDCGSLKVTMKAVDIRNVMVINTDNGAIFEEYKFGRAEKI